MCKHGTYKTVRLNRPRPVSGRTEVPVDACIADEVQYLNDKGVWTLGSCCGHGEGHPHCLIAKESEDLVIDLGYDPQPYEFNDVLVVQLKTTASNK